MAAARWAEEEAVSRGGSWGKGVAEARPASSRDQKRMVEGASEGQAGVTLRRPTRRPWPAVYNSPRRPARAPIHMHALAADQP